MEIFKIENQLYMRMIFFGYHKAAEELALKYPGKLILLRYEDLREAVQ